MKAKMALEQYQQAVLTNVDEANAHQLIQMLMTGALEKISAAKNCMQQQDIAEKGKNISLAITIVDGLQASLDLEKGGEVADNLFRLYHYIMELLLLANLHDDVSKLDEALNLMLTVKSGWDGISEEANEILSEKTDNLNETDQ